MLARLNLPEGFTLILAAFFGYAAEKKEAKEHVISVSRNKSFPADFPKKVTSRDKSIKVSTLTVGQ